MTYAEIMEKWGNVLCAFTHYYKYQFHYKGTSEDGYEILAIYGGDSGDIYRHEVQNNEVLLLSNLCPDQVTVYKDGIQVVHWDNY